MASYSRFGGPPPGYGRSGMQLGGFLTPGIKWILIINAIAFVAYFLTTAIPIRPLQPLFDALSLIPSWVVLGALWQPFTYLFLHDPHGFGHILFNSLTLWIFGINLERSWGTKKFLQFYFFCGVGAGLCDVVARFFFGGVDIPTIGNSGAVYGVLLAFGVLFPDTTVYFWMLFPIPARVFVAIIGGIAFLMTFGAAGSGVSHVAHLGGMVFGWIYLKHKPKFLNVDWIAWFTNWNRQRKLTRARKKFEVYMRKEGRDGDSGKGPGDWVN